MRPHAASFGSGEFMFGSDGLNSASSAIIVRPGPEAVCEKGSPVSFSSGSSAPHHPWRRNSPSRNASGCRASRDDGELAADEVSASRRPAHVSPRARIMDHSRDHRSPRGCRARLLAGPAERPEVSWRTAEHAATRTFSGTASTAPTARSPIPSEVPTGLRTSGAGLDTHRTNHQRLLQYVRTTEDDLRGHIVARQRSDAYQWALLISTHEQRHILQIREIKADPAFPAKLWDRPPLARSELVMWSVASRRESSTTSRTRL